MQVAEEVAPDIVRIAIPLTGSPLGTVNAFAIRSTDGLMLIDCGWNTPEAYDAIMAGLEVAGGGIKAVREIVITHIHPDHYGLAERLVEESGARSSMHRLDASYIGARYEDTKALVEEMDAWLRVNGSPQDEIGAMTAGSLRMVQRVGTRHPDVLLEGGEEIAWGRYRFNVIWTPGHSNGLFVLHDPNEKVMISSDHVLQRISPHIGMHVQSIGNPLDDFLTSLSLVRNLACQVVLPGHGKPFHDLAERVDELILHHERRCDRMLEAFDGRHGTAWDIAGRLTWRGKENGWDELEPFQRRMALTETIAHLEYLRGEGAVQKGFEDGEIRYAPRRAAVTS